MLDQNFVIVGTIIYLVGLASYVINTLKGRIKPNRVSFFLWALIPMVALAAQINEGVGIQSLTTFMAGFGPAAIFIASFINKKAFWKITKFDLICGALSIIGLLLWLITRQGSLAILFSIIADGLASVPTVAKAYRHPETETPFPWLTSTINGLLTLLTITTWTFAYYAFPLSIFITNLVIFILVKFNLNKFRIFSTTNQKKSEL